MRLIISTILLFMVATLLSEAIYWYFLVPRLSDYVKVPFLEWSIVFSPFLVASIFIAYLLHTWKSIPLHAVIASGVAITTRWLFLYFTGRPPGHDFNWSDLLSGEQFLSSILSVFIIMFIFSAVIGAFYCIRRKYKANSI
jgi:hypothetical protein